MREIISKKTVYHFNELTEKAKEKAREWYRSENDFSFYAENVIDDAKTIGKLLGIDIEKIYYSGFWSQGDGACFTGKYSPIKESLKTIKEYAPLDEKLHAIAETFDDILSRNELTVTIKHVGMYYHENSVNIDVDHSDEELNYSCYGDDAELLKDTLKDFMRWIYRSLEKEYDFMNSNEQVDDSILANEYEFDENGRIA